MPSYLRACGSYLPAHIVKNEDLVQFPFESLALIEKKTGVRTRHHAAPGELTSDLAVKAAQKCLERAGQDAGTIDALVLSTSSPDRLQPPTAARVQDLLGARRAFAFDINAVCTGGLYALRVGSALLAEGTCSHVLVVAAELYSRLLNPEDFATYPYFGDGAAAVLLQRAALQAPALVHVDSRLYSDGSGRDVIQIPGGGTMLPALKIKQPSEAYFRMQGKKVFDFAVQRGSEVINEILDANNVAMEQVHTVITHQANINIVEEIARRTRVPRERFFVNLDRIGNTASASVLIALDEVVLSKSLPSKGFIVLAAFGGGLAWGASLLSIV